MRLNYDPSTDRRWMPGDPEPGDPGWDFAKFYGVFAKAGFNSSAGQLGYVGILAPREIYEFSVTMNRIPGTGQNGTDGRRRADRALSGPSPSSGLDAPFLTRAIDEALTLPSPKGRGKKHGRSFSLLSLWERRAGVVRAHDAELSHERSTSTIGAGAELT